VQKQNYVLALNMDYQGASNEVRIVFRWVGRKFWRPAENRSAGPAEGARLPHVSVPVPQYTTPQAKNS
jgi:hypothetical protein